MSTTNDKIMKPGWYKPRYTNSKFYHHNHHGTSICGGYGTYGIVDKDITPAPPFGVLICKTCKKLVDEQQQIATAL